MLPLHPTDPARIVISINTSWNIVNFRSGLVCALIESGYEVIALAPPDEYSQRIAEIGCGFVPIKIDSGGTNPIKDAILFIDYLRYLRHVKPNVYLGYTVKPNIYGSLAAHALGIPVINNIAGLGTVFIRKNVLYRLVKTLYRTALSRSKCVFFQNKEDLKMFEEQRIVHTEKTALLPGSGVDLEQFQPCDLPATHVNDKVRFLFIARILRDKGIGEYIEATRKLKAEGHKIDSVVLGFLDVKNPTAIDRATMDEWSTEGIIDYLGSTDDVRPHIAAADCVVLPSYYPEGTPRSLLEAAAMGRPIITTDMPGCRNVVDHEVSGFLCQPRDAADLRVQMQKILSLSPDGRIKMGRAGRIKVEREFDERIVINNYLEAINSILQDS